MKTYSDLKRLETFKERFNYLSIGAEIGDPTFGAERYLNQVFYRSSRWRRFRDYIILRDSYNGYPCDIGCHDHPIIGDSVIIHHINPITIEDIETESPLLLDPNNAICVSDLTHRAIHYSTFDLLPKDYIPRRPNDTIPWR